MSSEPSSLLNAFSAAVAEVPGAIGGVAVDAGQLDLLRDETTGKLPRDVFRRMRDGAARRGRPPGATNKRNRKIAQLIVQEHGDPVMFMASIYSQPLDQVVELLKLADDSADVEARLFELAESIQTAITNTDFTKPEQVRKAEQLADRLADIAKVLRSTPGDLAVKALALQFQASKEAATYVHGKQPVSVEVSAKADMVLIVPGINAPLDVALERIETDIRERGLDALDLESMTIVEGEHSFVGDGDTE